MVQYSPTVDRAFAALADPNRRAVLERLGAGSATISELAEPFGMSLTGMKKHIRLLDGEGRPRSHVHARALRLRGHQHVAAAARPLRPGRRTHERSTMSTTTKGKKSSAKSTKKKEGFTAEEKAAMRARARELKDQTDGESAVRAAIAAMSPKDRALAKRLHALVKATAPDLTPKTWYGMPAYAKDGKVVCFFRNATKFKERYAMFGFNDSAKLDEGSMWPVAFAVKELTVADEARIAALVKRAVG
jgi:uncharacterized protein YdhG (YjbR/CyaY superfamily)